MALTTATAIINLSALKHNLAQIKALAPTTKILAVLKANAYGHGLERIAHALFDEHNDKAINESTVKHEPPLTADALAVARIDEALALRASGISQPIVLLEGIFDSKDLAILAENNLQTVIHNQQQLDAILAANISSPLKVWLKIDTGMHRLGISPEQFPSFYQQLHTSSNVQNGMVLMSHLGCADEKTSETTVKQIALFQQVTKNCQEARSLANSAGICAWPESHYQWVRPGLLLYGVSPLPFKGLASNEKLVGNVQPVMTLKSSLIAVRELAAGEPVGYGGAWQSKEKTVIGVVAIGYGDGYPRHAKNGTPVLVNGRRVPLVGRVSMDMITVDLGLNAQEQVGDIVTLWGEQLPVAEIAQCATTIPYELLCNITRRVQITLSVE
jgi:alanine racemase